MNKTNGVGSETANPFDPKHLRISQRFGEGAEIRRVLVTVPVRKPHKQEFFRIHPAADMRLEAAILDFKEQRQTYIVDPGIWPELPGETAPKMLYSAITRSGTLILWPVRLHDEHGRLDDWNASAHEAARRAETLWVRMASNMSLGAYDIFEALGQIPDPEWPDLPLEKLLEIAFRGRFIDSLGHPVLRHLRGEI